MRPLTPFACVLLLCSPSFAQGVWMPEPGATWQWQITGVVDESFEVENDWVGRERMRAAWIPSFGRRD